MDGSQYYVTSEKERLLALLIAVQSGLAETIRKKKRNNYMKIIGAVIIIALFLLGVFLFANWNVLTTPTRLSFVFFDAEAPLSFILLVVTLVLVALSSIR